MRVIRKTIVTDINHEDLVNLFSTALTGSDMLGCDYDKDFWGLIDPEKRQGDCFEDRIADTLLNGGTVYMYDYYAEGELYGGKGELIEDSEESDGDGMYAITLKDVIEGLQRAADGSFKWDDEYEKAEARENFDNYVDEGDYGNFDLDMAENLMQIIMFNEVVYA